MEAQVKCSEIVRASSELKMCSPARFAEISGRIDADLQDRIATCKSFASCCPATDISSSLQCFLMCLRPMRHWQHDKELAKLMNFFAKD